MPDFDVVLVADPCFPGGSSTALANEIRAASQAGLACALRPVRSARLAQRRLPVGDVLAALKTTKTPVLSSKVAVEARLALVCHPYLFDDPLSRPLMVRADHVALIAHHPPVNRAGEPEFSTKGAIAAARDIFGRDLRILPVSTTVRRVFTEAGFADALAEIDWPNLLDLDTWPLAPRRNSIDRVRIGRHARPDLLKWPEPELARLVYPDHPDFEIHIAGVNAKIKETFVPWPSSWRGRAFEHGISQEFLQGLDLYAYFHSSTWIEAFGYNVLEAMASGLPVVLPPHFEEVFGPAAQYVRPEEAAETYRKLAKDRAAAAQLGDAGRAFAEASHGLGGYGARVEALIGAPASVARPRARGIGPERVLTITSNGVGVGHLSRQLAIASAQQPGIETVFFSLSKAVRFAQEAGFVSEYRAFHRQIGADPALWNDWFEDELSEAIALYQPSAVIFDGNMPYQGMLNAFRQREEAARIWVRRGLWREANHTAMKRGALFDLVIEPQDLAEQKAPGFEALDTLDVLKTPPILSVPPERQLSQSAARRLLNLPIEGEIALLQLGSESNFDMSLVRDTVLNRLLGQDRLVVELLSPARTDAWESLGPQHQSLSTFPAFLYAQAFDFAISACGYNSFHEIIATRLPCLFVPNVSPEMDLQEARATYASQCGWALMAKANDPYGLASAVDRLARDPLLRKEMRNRMAAVSQAFDGAHVAAEAIAFAMRTAPRRVAA